MAPFFVSVLSLGGDRLPQVGLTAQDQERHVTEKNGVRFFRVIVIGALDDQVQILFLPSRLNGSADLKEHIVRAFGIFDLDAVSPVSACRSLSDFALGVIQAEYQLGQLLRQSMPSSTERAGALTACIQDGFTWRVAFWLVLLRKTVVRERHVHREYLLSQLAFHLETKWL